MKGHHQKRFDTGHYHRSPAEMTDAAAKHELEAIGDLSHGPTCAIRFSSAAECTCGKIDRMIELEDRLASGRSKQTRGRATRDKTENPEIQR
jgi:hypothetical protein